MGETASLQYLDHPRDQSQSGMSLASLLMLLLSDIAPPHYLTVVALDLVTLHYKYMRVCVCVFDVNTLENTHFGLILSDYQGIPLHNSAC